MVFIDRASVVYSERWDEVLDITKKVITCSGVSNNKWQGGIVDTYALQISYPESLVSKLYEDTQEFLVQHVSDLYKSITTSGDENLLSEYKKHWQPYRDGAGYLDRLFHHLNLRYVAKHPRMMNIRQLALSIWKTEMIDRIASEKLVKLVLQEVEVRGNGGIVNDSAIHGVITSFIDVNIFEEGEESIDFLFLQRNL